jgi:predicted PurR-regulated permease PerM
LGIPYASALALAVFLCGLIPLIGHFAGITIVTVVALTHKPIIGAIAFVLYLVYVQIENYIIMPRIMKKSLEIPGIVTILAALLGTSLLGIVGGLMAVPIAAAVLLILDEVVFPNAEKS